MRYPDELIWANQFLEIFGGDCYGAGTLPRRPVVIDGGANIGTFACWVKWLRPQARVIAIEPSPANVEYLRANVNGLPMPEVEIVEAALGTASDQPVKIGGSVSDSLRTGVNTGEPVRVRPLADLIQERVDLLKLDIEGAEIDALLSAGDALRRVRRMVVEYHEFRDADGDRIAADSTRARPGAAALPRPAGSGTRAAPGACRDRSEPVVRLSRLIGLLEEHGFDRFRLSDHREFTWTDPALPRYCCLLDATRSGR